MTYELSQIKEELRLTLIIFEGGDHGSPNPPFIDLCSDAGGGFFWGVDQVQPGTPSISNRRDVVDGGSMLNRLRVVLTRCTCGTCMYRSAGTA